MYYYIMGQNLPKLNLPSNIGTSFSSAGCIPPLSYQGDNEALHVMLLLTSQTMCSLRVAYSHHRADCSELVLISSPLALHSSRLSRYTFLINIIKLGTNSSYIIKSLLHKTYSLAAYIFMPHPLSKVQSVLHGLIYTYPSG